MVDLDDLDLFPKPAEPRPGAAPPRKCRRHMWMVEQQTGHSYCQWCGVHRDPVKSKRGKNNRARGNADELVVARLLGGRKVGPLGLPHDVEVDGYMRVQAKKLLRWPSLASVVRWLDEMQPGGDVRAVSIADTPGPGGRTRRLLIVDLEEFARWHGGKS